MSKFTNLFSFTNRLALACLVLVLAVLFALASASAVRAQAVANPCDLNNDGRIDSRDILIIRQMNNWVVAPGSYGDANGDGVINIADMRFCQLRCTSPNCATS